jgi:hypothetical protein
MCSLSVAFNKTLIESRNKNPDFTDELIMQY